MTVEAMSGLSLQAGSALAAAARRCAIWAVSAYMRQPLRNSAVAALVGLSAMAGSNALYHQAHHHPAPLFGSFSAATVAPSQARAKKLTAPVMPAQRPKQLDLVDNGETTGSVDPAAIVRKAIGNDDVAAVQRQLTALSLFDGAVDGLFGPRTSRAIKAFEAKLGRPAKGQLTPEIVALIKASQPLPAPAETNSAPSAAVATAPAPIVDDKPLPAPSPLLRASSQPAENDTEIADLADESPAVQTLPMTKPNAVPKRSVQTIAVHAQTLPEQVMPAAVAPASDVPPATEGEDGSSDKSVVTTVQRGLNSLGFLHGEISGIADEATSKAIRNFEVYYNYDVTGKISKGLVNLLQQAGAVI